MRKKWNAYVTRDDRAKYIGEVSESNESLEIPFPLASRSLVLGSMVIKLRCEDWISTCRDAAF